MWQARQEHLEAFHEIIYGKTEALANEPGLLFPDRNSHFFTGINRTIMLFNLRLTIGGEVITCTGFYSHSSNPFQPVAKHRADGISSHNGRWFSRAIIQNWHTAKSVTPVTPIKKAQTRTAYA